MDGRGQLQPGAGRAPAARTSQAPEQTIGRRRTDRVIATHPATQRAVEAAMTAARSELPVLVWGPPGSGRSFFARAVHAWSPRAQAPLEELVCHALSPTLQERSLFGPGPNDRDSLPDSFSGLLDRLAGGTLVIEGWESLEGRLREQLVTALSTRRLPGSPGRPERPLRTRIIATAERPPSPAPFGSVAHHEVALAPLSERSEEILPLATHFLAAFARDSGRPVVGFTREAREALLSEPWRGNLTELRERIRQALELSPDGAIGPEALLLAADQQALPSFREAKRSFETRYVTTLLRVCQGNVSQAARLAQKDRKDFYDVIRRTGVRPADFRR